MQRKIGFIGTGLMGAGMARNLIRKGHTVRIYNRTRAKAEEVAKLGGQVASTPAEAAEGADAIVTMVADPTALLEVVAGADGILKTIAAGAVLIDSSTVSPPTTLRVLEMLKAKGADMIDAPVFGSKNEAEKGELGFIVGADPAVLARVQDVLDCMGRTIPVGGNGKGASAKLVVNLIVASTLEAFNEGLVLATKAGIDPDTMVRVLMSSRARAGIMDMKAAPVLARDFTPFFPLQLMAKDMRLVAEAAGALGVELPFATAINRVFSACLEQGLAEQDFSAMIKLLEKQAGVEVKSSATAS